MPKNILRCSASLRMDGIAKRLITTEMAVEIKGAIQRYFLFQKKKNTTDAMGMIQNTEIFHQFINIPLSPSFLLILSYLKNTYKAIFSWSCLTLLRNKKALGIPYLKKNPVLNILILFPAIFPAIFPAVFLQTAVLLQSVLLFPANPGVFSRYG